MKLIWALLLILFAGLVSAAAPEDEDAVTVEEENVTTEKTAKSATGEPLVPRVSTSFLLPENPFHMVVNGEAVTLLLGFHNRGIPADKLQELSESERESLDQTLQLVGIQGHFTKPGDFDQIIRNVTRMNYYAQVPEQHQTTVQYRFKTDFEPGEIGLLVNLEFTNSRSEGFSVVGFKGNLKVADPIQQFDFQMLFVYAVVVVLIIGVGYLAKAAFIGSSKGGRRSSADVQQKPASSQRAGNEWIPETHLKQISSPTRQRKQK